MDAADAMEPAHGGVERSGEARGARPPRGDGPRPGRGRWIALAVGVPALAVACAAAWIGWPHLRFWWLFERLGRNAEGCLEYRHRATGIVFVRLPGGRFPMGSPEGEEGRNEDEGPVHDVELSPFLMAKHEVTQAECERVMGGNPSHFQGADLPVERVSWDDCREFCRRTGLQLSTEAQWECACRAGTTGPYAGTGRLDDMGWYEENSAWTTHPVGRKQANGFGLHDLHGNVSEWCEDVYDKGFYATADACRKDPVRTSGSEFRVFRGGSWFWYVRLRRSAYRLRLIPGNRFFNLGFRPAARLP